MKKRTRKQSESYFQFGDAVEDSITSFGGVVTGRCEYISGCDQYLVQPKGLDDKKQPFNSRWLDGDRLVLREPADVKHRVVRAGPDREAPKK